MRAGEKRRLNVEVGTLSAPGEPNRVSGNSGDALGGRLGLKVGALNSRLQRASGISEGVVVTQVIRDGAGAEAGLRLGDIIVQLGFEEIHDLEHYRAVEEGMEANKLVPLRFFRSGRSVFRTIVIEE
jgi:serine protease Do